MVRSISNSSSMRRTASLAIEASVSRPAKPARLKSRDAGSFKGLLIRMNLEGWRALRILAAETDTTLNALAIEALNDLLKKHGRRQSVENPLAD